MELWDIYDRDRMKTGETMLRGASFADGAYHLVAQVCIFNRKGEMLIQQRQPFKEGWPNLWDLTAGGSATAGETSQAAAQRELWEEIGYRINFENLRPHLTVNFPRSFVDYYLVEAEADIRSLQLQQEEVQAVKWASKEEILGRIAEGTFIPFHPSFLGLLFEMRKGYGALSE